MFQGTADEIIKLIEYAISNPIILIPAVISGIISIGLFAFVIVFIVKVFKMCTKPLSFEDDPFFNPKQKKNKRRKM